MLTEKTMDSKTVKGLPTHKMVRKLPEWAKVVKTINEVPIYNMNIFENIMSWNQYNLDIPAMDYYGTVITFKDLPERVREYVAGFQEFGVNKNDVVTLCLPVSIENVLSLFAINCAGAISNSPNFLFLRNDFKTYTKDKNSKVLIILDAYLPFVIDDLEGSGISKVIITSLKDNLPENNQHIFDDVSRLSEKLREVFGDEEKQKACLQKIPLIKGVDFIRMPEIVKLGQKSSIKLPNEPINIDREVSYSYTSGTTTGKPKCIVYKEVSANAFIELHKGIDTKDYVGDRALQVIPLTHSTGERVCCYMPLARGKTLVPQPIYNKNSFGVDLYKSKCNWVTAAPSFYLAGVAQGKIADNAFEHLTRPSSGGEPVTKSNVELIDKWLQMNGCKVRFAIGGGAAEDGSGTIFTYFMDEKSKTNETGHPIEPGIKVKIVNELGNIVSKGERGYLHVSSAAAADRYLNNEAATKARWYYDENGIRWGITGDIAVQNADGSYNILGRASDSCKGKDGKTIYLFDIEYALEAIDPIIEWEITSHQINDGHNVIVGQVVLKKEYIGKEAKVIEHLCRKYHLDAVKIYKCFESSEVTGKRDFQKLKADTDGYYAPYDENHLTEYKFPAGEKPISRIVTKNNINNFKG